MPARSTLRTTRSSIVGSRSSSCATRPRTTTLASFARRALLERGHASILGFAAIRDYPEDSSGRGDIDSGPVVLGVSVSATGFALSAARRQRDADRFASLYRTAALFGTPVSRNGITRMVAGGPLGNAILLAMLTARRS